MVDSKNKCLLLSEQIMPVNCEPQNPKAQERMYFMLKYIALVSIIFHTLFIGFYHHYHLTLLSIYNMASAPLWVLVYILNEKKWLNTAVGLAFSEAIIYVNLAIFYFGFEINVEIWFILMAIVPFLMPTPHNILKFLAFGIVLGCYLFWMIHLGHYAPLFRFGPLVNQWFRIVNITTVFALCAFLFYKYRFIAEAAEEGLEKEHQKSEALLHNILPEPIAMRLKKDETMIADGFTDASVLFSDIVGFTELSAKISPQELVSLLNEVFSRFDDLTESFGLEKIKTIGDAFMAASGIPVERSDHAEVIADFALQLIEELQNYNTQTRKDIHIRVGINSGPVVAGIIGRKKFIYDLWGDTVNTAARMESHGVVDQIQVSPATYELLKDKYIFDTRGSIHVKGKGEMITYFLKEKC